MADLRALCERAGLSDVRTYIQSGNVVARSKLSTDAFKKKLESALGTQLGKPHRVLVRALAELQAVEKRNPYPDAAPNQLLVLFLDDAPAKGALKDWKIPGREQMTIKGRELYVHFPDGMGSSKLKVPFADIGTGRNLNTVRAMIALAILPV